MNRLWIFCLALSCGLPGGAFVVFPVGNQVLKWNVSSPQVRPSAVNPATKAIRYYIASDAWSEAGRTNEINAVRACFDQWQSVSGTDLRFEFAGFLPPEGLDTRYDNTNVVFWAKRSLRVNSGTEDLTNRRAWTSVTYAVDGSILDADIVLNGVQYQWFTNPADTVNQAQFIEAIVLHEIGHFLGLDHSPAGGATVIDAGNGINTNRGLSADDIAAVRYLYRSGTNHAASVRGTVRRNGTGILGAVVVVEDAAGNIAGATVTQPSGAYAVHSLPAGSHRLRVTPLDPAGSGSAYLLRGADIALDGFYGQAVTGFLPTPHLALVLQEGEARVQDVNVTAGEPPFRITSVSRPAAQADLITVARHAVSLTQGQSNFFVGVSSPGFQQGAALSITGDGLTVGPAVFYSGRAAPGLHSLVVPVSVSSNATPGLRSLIVTHNGASAYANGYLEIAPAVPDDNFDGLDDRFQRQYWPLWTAPEARPPADPDDDGFSNAFEYRTGTHPADPLSFRLAVQPPAGCPLACSISWLSDPGKTYQVHRASELASGVWQALGQPVTAQGVMMTLPVEPLPGGAYFRLELKR